jgi:hypothetical protein
MQLIKCPKKLIGAIKQNIIKINLDVVYVLDLHKLPLRAHDGELRDI